MSICSRSMVLRTSEHGLGRGPSRGGGGGTSIIMYAYWVCAARETPASPFYIFWRIFAVPEPDHHFQNFFNFNPFIASSGRPERQPDASWQFRRLAFSRSKRVKLVPEPPHFHAQNGSSSFRSPAFSRSTGSSFQSPGPFFTLPRHIPTKIWGEYPPPPPLRGSKAGRGPELSRRPFKFFKLCACPLDALNPHSALSRNEMESGIGVEPLVSVPQTHLSRM